MKESYSQQEVTQLLGVTRQMVWQYEKKGFLDTDSNWWGKRYLNNKKLKKLLKERERPNLFDNHEKRIAKLEEKVALLIENSGR